MNGNELLRVLGQHIRLLRERRGWSQEELAQRCGRHFTYVGRVERGQQNITVAVLREIASAFDVPIGDLFSTHHLLDKWKVGAMDIIEAISHGFRAQVDVKGKLAEWMLYKQLRQLKEERHVDEVSWLDEDGRPDFVIVKGERTLNLECKNVRSPTPNRRSPEPIRVELQKTRNARDGSETRAYGATHFDILSACLFNRTGNWDFVHVAARHLETRPDDDTLLTVMQRVPATPAAPWRGSVLEVIRELQQ